MSIKLPVQFLIVLGLFSKTGTNSLPPSMRPMISGISSVAFFSRDMEDNISFYGNYLGFPDILPLDSKYSRQMQRDFKINRKQYIRLIAEKTPGNRLAYFSIETANAEAFRRYLALKRIKVPDSISSDSDGSKGFFITDPDGTVCRIVQNPPNDELSSTDIVQAEPKQIAARIGHVGFMVRDLDKSIRFYVGLLGFKETWRGSKNGKNLSWVNLKVPNGPDYVELMLYDKPQSQENMGILNHVSLEVNDIYQTEKKLDGRALPSNCKATSSIKIGINKKRQINSFDIDGTRIEIMEANTINGIPAKSSNAKPLKFHGSRA